MLKQLLFIAAGGALGALGRFGSTRLSVWLGWEKHFPAATLAANFLGCLLMGFVMGLIAARLPREGASFWQSFIVIGFIGSLTTFSTFAFQTRELSLTSWWLAALNVTISVAGGVLLVMLGLFLAGLLASRVE